ncbi:MAG: hypothetical protein ACPHCJ_05795 [Oceanococcaceae bacterium]
MRIARISLLASFGSALFLLGCDEGARSPDLQPRLDRIEVCAMPSSGVCPSAGCPTANAVVPAGRTQAFCAVGFFEGVDTADVTIPRSSRDITESVQWESSVTQVAVIEEDTGIADAQTEGTTIISAARDGISGNTLLQVVAPDLERITIAPPLVGATVPNAITIFSCTGEYSNDSCPGSNPNLCDLTNDAEWQSLRPGVARVGNNPVPGSLESKGVMLAVAPGTTAITCSAPDQEGNILSATASPVRVCDADLLPAPDGLQLTLNGTVLDTSVPLRIVSGQTRNLGLRGNFINQDEDCGPIGAPFSLNLTDSANWVSDRPEVVTVGNRFRQDKGRVTYAGPGLAEVFATFSGSTVGVQFIAVDANVLELRINGPEFLFAPGEYNYQAEVLYSLADAEQADALATVPGCEPAAEDSQNQVLCDVTTAVDILWTAEKADGSSAAGVAEFANNDGRLGVAADAPPQVITIRANFRGAEASKPALIVPAELVDVQVNPGLVCLDSGTLGIDLVSGPGRRLRLDLLYDITLPGQEEPLRCRLPENENFSNAEIAVWRSQSQDPFVGSEFASGSDLLSALPNLLGSLGLGALGGPLGEFVGGCQALLPVGVVGDDEGPSDSLLTGSPVFVSNQAGNRGAVTANEQALLGLGPLSVGTACVSALVDVPGEEPGTVTTLFGSNSVLVATEATPEVCSALEGLTDGLLTDGVPPDTLSLVLGLLVGTESAEPNCLEALQAIGEDDGSGEEGGGEGEGGSGNDSPGNPLDIILDILLGGGGL